MNDPAPRPDLLDHLRRCPSCAVLLTATRGRRDAGSVTAWRHQLAEHLAADSRAGVPGAPARTNRPS
jgi:hypothetical protein